MNRQPQVHPQAATSQPVSDSNRRFNVKVYQLQPEQSRTGIFDYPKIEPTSEKSGFIVNNDGLFKYQISKNDEILSQHLLTGKFDDVIYLQSKNVGFIGSSSTSQILRFVGDGENCIQFCKVDMVDGEQYKFDVDMYETKLATQVSDNEIIIFYDTDDAMRSFVKISDPTYTSNSKIAYFTFLGKDHFLIANSASKVNIFKLSEDQVEQCYHFSPRNFDETREIVHFGCKTLNEDRVALLSSNYSRPNLTFSTIYVFRVSPTPHTIPQHQQQTGKLPDIKVSPEKIVNMELFRKKGWDPNLSSVNIDFLIEEFPFLMGFPQDGPHIYSMDLGNQKQSGQNGESRSKAINIGQGKTRSLKFFEKYLFGVDENMQVIEISRV